MALKDVKYMQMAGYPADKIPAPAQALYDKRDVYRRNLVHSDQIARSYNKINMSANPVESVLLERKLQDIDKIIERGEKSLKWKNDDSKAKYEIHGLNSFD